MTCNAIRLTLNVTQTALQERDMATLNIRLENDLKESAYKVLEREGISPSDLIRSVFQYISDNQRLPIRTTMSDSENFEGTKTVWTAYVKTRKQSLEITAILRKNCCLEKKKVDSLFAEIDSFVAILNIQAVSLIMIKDWLAISSELHKFGNILKHHALTSNLGDEFAKYSDSTISELSTLISDLDKSVYDLMLNTRYL